MLLQLLHTPPYDGATNMATDEALLTRARASGDVIVRIYTWQRTTLSFGRHQTACGVYDGARAAAAGFDVVRRPTGGRAVLHAREVTYSVCAPVDTLAPADAPPRAAYSRINGLIADALASLGVPVAAATPSARARRPDGAPCFDAPAAGELVVRSDDARKLVGSAQWREGGSLLQHGSILLADDQPLLARCMLDQPPNFAPAASLEQALGRMPAIDEIAHALFGAAKRLAAELGADVERADPDDPAHAREVARLLPRYVDPSWTWRR